jgi:hypothetical protein
VWLLIHTVTALLRYFIAGAPMAKHIELRSLSFSCLLSVLCFLQDTPKEIRKKPGKQNLRPTFPLPHSP